MLSFLRLFEPFRAAEARISEMTTERAALRGRAEAEADARRQAEAALVMAKSELADWKEKSAGQDEEIKRLNAQFIEEAHKIADTMSVHAIGKRFFSKASDVPPSDTPPQMQPTGRQFARTLAIQQAQKVRGELQKMWDELPSGEN